MKANIEWQFAGVFWGECFIQACADLIIAGAVSSWFFNRVKPENPIRNSIRNLFMFHLGSAALGSLLIAICRFLRFILSIIQRQCADRGNVVATFILCCCSCCLSCFESFLKYMTRIAYVVISEYCSSKIPALSSRL